MKCIPYVNKIIYNRTQHFELLYLVVFEILIPKVWNIFIESPDIYTHIYIHTHSQTSLPDLTIQHVLLKQMYTMLGINTVICFKNQQSTFTSEVQMISKKNISFESKNKIKDDCFRLGTTILLRFNYFFTYCTLLNFIWLNNVWGSIICFKYACNNYSQDVFCMIITVTTNI